MKKIERVLRCYNCGAVLQDKNPKLPGYCDSNILAKGPNKIIYCNKCYDNIIKLNSFAEDFQIDQDILTVLDDAVATDAMILWVIDLFQFAGNINEEIAKKIKNLHIAAVVTKLDLFPGKPKTENIIDYIKSAFAKYNINLTSVLFADANKIDVKESFKEMKKAAAGHDVYLIGNSASGKTTLINKMLKGYTNKTNRTIRTYEYPKTSMKVLEIPLSNSSFFYELPGISNSCSLISRVEKDVLKMIFPKKTIKVSSKVLMENEYLVVGSLGAFEIHKGKPTAIKFYSSDGVETKRVNAKNMEKTCMDNFVRRTIRPVSDRYTSFVHFDLFDIYMEKDNKYHDICIEGLGWISFKATGQIIRVITPKGVAITENLSKIG